MTTRLWLTLLAFTMLAHTWAVRAESVITTVFNVFESQKTERILVLSGTDGRIYKMAKSESNLKNLKAMTGQVVIIDYSERGEEAIINSINVARADQVDQRTMDLNHFQYNELRTFAPTDLQTYEAANSVFQNMLNDGDKGRSQCFKRAHMWAYDMWSKLGISSQKLFIFYTKRYSILEDFEWWFHVTPLVTVNGVEYTMDGTFMEKPITIKAWKDYFIKSEKITCPMIENYLEFDNDKHPEYQWNHLCYLMKTPMYNFRPLDIEDRDLRGMQRNHWVLEELQDARRAFKGYDKTYEGLDNGKATVNH
jgi:hypothetical protein